MAYNTMDNANLDLAVTRQESATLTLGAGQFYIIADSGLNDVALTLPRGVNGADGTASVGKIYVISCMSNSGNNVTLSHHANDRLRKAPGARPSDHSGSPLTLDNGKTMWLIYTGVFGGNGEWHVIAEFDGGI